MKKTVLLIYPALIVLCLACAPPDEGQVVNDTAADEESLRTMIAQYTALFAAGDLEGIMDLYGADIVQMPPDEPAIMGESHLQDGFQVFLDENTVELKADVQDIRISGDLASVRVSYKQSMTPTEGGETVVEVGKWVLVCQREDGGDWKIVIEIWNADQPPEES